MLTYICRSVCSTLQALRYYRSEKLADLALDYNIIIEEEEKVHGEGEGLNDATSASEEPQLYMVPHAPDSAYQETVFG